MRYKALILLFAFCSTQVCRAGEETLHGFVVGVSPTGTIALDDFNIERENRLSIEINSINPGTPQKSLDPNAIHVGEELEIRGDFKSATRQLTVKSVKILSEDKGKLEISAFSDGPPELQKTPTGWNGYIFVEGMRIQVIESTAMAYRKKNTVIKDPNSGAKVEIVQKLFPLTSLDGIGPDTTVHFEGVRRNDGSVLASKVDFEDFELRPGETKLLQKLVPRIEKTNARIQPLGELHIGRNKFKLLPQQDAQDYLQKLGESLIPPHQQELPTEDPLKISYRFYLAEDKDYDIASFPNGVIVVKSGLFDGMENEAQLAFHLSRAIALVEEMYLWQLMRDNRSNKRIVTTAAVAAGLGVTVFGGPIVGLVVYDGMRDDYLNFLTDQQDRLALEWMLAAGYDIREAPRAYKAYVLTHPDHTSLYPRPFANQTEKNTKCAERRSFLMAELRNNYSQTDYLSLKTDSDQFRAIERQTHQLLKP
jgi:hypothetical protein